MITPQVVFVVVVAAGYTWWLRRNWVRAWQAGGWEQVAAVAALVIATAGYAVGFVSIAGPIAQQLGWLEARYALAARNLVFVVTQPLLVGAAVILVIRDLLNLMFDWSRFAQLIWDLAVLLGNALEIPRWLATVPAVWFDFVTQPGFGAGKAALLVLVALTVGYGLAQLTGPRVAILLDQRRKQASR